MRTLLTLLGREIKSYFYSPTGYVVLCFFLVLTGFNFWIAVSVLNRGPVEVTVVSATFNTVLFWWGFVLIFPLITMGLFSEEMKMGTIEPLMTAPVRDWQVIAAKFLGCFLFYIILYLPSVAYFVMFREIAGKDAANSFGAYAGSYGLLLLLGMFYISVGCVASVLTRNQIIAAVVAFTAVSFLFFVGLVSNLVMRFSPEIQDIFAYFSAIEHMDTFSKGIIDTRAIVWYLSMTFFMLFVAHQIFQSRKWRV